MSILISALLWAGIDIRQVIGLTFVITLANSVVAIGTYFRNHHVDLRVGLWVATPAMGCVLLGHQLSDHIDTHWLTGVMLVCLFAMGIKFIFAPHDRQHRDAIAAGRPMAAPLVLMGGIAGFVMGVMGGGGAVFLAIALAVFFKMETKTAIGTSLLVMGLAAIPGVVSHVSSETIKISLVTPILMASLPAAYVASWYANRIPKELIKRILGTYLVCISTLLLFRALI